MKKEWKPNTAKHGTGEELWMGKIKVGSWFNPTVTKGEPAKYRAHIDLPGIKLSEGTIDWPNADKARARVERAVATWFLWLEEDT